MTKQLAYSNKKFYIKYFLISQMFATFGIILYLTGKL